MTTLTGKKSGRTSAKPSPAASKSSAATTRQASPSSRSAGRWVSASTRQPTDVPENGVELRWLNRHDEIPDGWRVAQQSLVHHHR